MKIKVQEKSYDEVMALAKPKHRKPCRPSVFFRTLVRLISTLDLWKVRFRYTGKMPDSSEGPCLVLMNHSSFIDLKIAHKILYPRHFGIVCAHDALVGKSWLMRRLGCIPTRKFVSDLALIHDMQYMLDKKINVLMYPEAGYSFDGRATVLPDRFGRLIKMLGVPVVFIEAKGAFARDPLYNGLKLRRVPVSAHVERILTKEDVKNM
jgi:1-acyl-sn-glycerol-3-phosphate acyltransferase